MSDHNTTAGGRQEALDRLRLIAEWMRWHRAQSAAAQGEGGGE